MKQTAIVTGAARNIGKGIATHLGREKNMQCVLVDNDEAALAQTHAELQDSGVVCEKYLLNIGSVPGVKKFTDWLKKERILAKVLVNNAAYESEASVLSLSPSELQRSTQVNTAGPFYLTSLFSQRLIEAEQPGSVVFISSTHSRIIRRHPLYSAAKAAIEMFMVEAALELAPYGIRVNAVAPGPVEDTPEPNANGYVPLGVSQQPVDVAQGVAFLASDEARFITGQTLTVDGGFSIAHTHHWIGQGKI